MMYKVCALEYPKADASQGGREMKQLLDTIVRSLIETLSAGGFLENEVSERLREQRHQAFAEATVPKVTQAHLDARREQILNAAVACFEDKGFHQTTMADICGEAELSPGDDNRMPMLRTLRKDKPTRKDLDQLKKQLKIFEQANLKTD